MSKSRERLIGAVGVELSALLSGARAVTSEAAASFVDGEDGLSPVSFHISGWLHAFGTARATEIAAGLAMDKGAVSRAVSNLERAGIVEKLQHPEDARAQAIALTTEGRHRIERALAGKGAKLHARLARFEDEELRQLTDLLRRLNALDE